MTQTSPSECKYYVAFHDNGRETLTMPIGQYNKAVDHYKYLLGHYDNIRILLDITDEIEDRPAD